MSNEKDQMKELPSDGGDEDLTETNHDHDEDEASHDAASSQTSGVSLELQQKLEPRRRSIDAGDKTSKSGDEEDTNEESGAEYQDESAVTFASSGDEKGQMMERNPITGAANNHLHATAFASEDDEKGQETDRNPSAPSNEAAANNHLDDYHKVTEPRQQENATSDESGAEHAEGDLYATAFASEDEKGQVTDRNTSNDAAASNHQDDCHKVTEPQQQEDITSDESGTEDDLYAAAFSSSEEEKGQRDPNTGAANKDDCRQEELQYDYHVVNASLKETRSSGVAVVKENSFTAAWTDFVLQKLHEPIHKVLHVITQHAARNPLGTLLGVSLLSAVTMFVGLATNFYVEYDEFELWTPPSSLPRKHGDWVGSVYPYRYTNQLFIFHEDGNNVLGRQQVERVVELVSAIKELPGYEAVCAGSEHVDPYSGETTCPITGITNFWNNSAEAFNMLSDHETDQEIVARLSQKFYPDGSRVGPSKNFGGNWVRGENDQLKEVLAYNVEIILPNVEGADALETEIIDLTMSFRDKWKDDEQGFRFRGELIAGRSFGDEFRRAIVQDLPLVPVVFIIMSCFTAFFFARRHPIYSRSLLGFSAVVTIAFSLMTGFGLCFAIGVPFTSLAQLIPFVVFGIGLDDAFIIMGSYSRFDYIRDTPERIRATVDEIGVAITITTLTSSLAFAIGCISDIPAVYWLCLYAFPTIIIDYLYQLTFFVACIVLDERRIQNRRRDCCVCLVVQSLTKDPIRHTDSDQDDVDEDVNDEISVGEAQLEDKRQALYEGWMRSYTKRLLHPWVKMFVVVAFAALSGVLAWRASLLTQQFKFTEVVPKDSYLIDLMDAMHTHAGMSFFWPQAHFRYVDQSDPGMQQQMEDFLDELVAMKSINNPPSFVWWHDLREFSNATGKSELPFETQLDAFLADPVFANMYEDDIVRDASGAVTSSRVQLLMDGVNDHSVSRKIDALFEQRDVSARQPINRGKRDLCFFTYQSMYNMWEFYSRAVDELILTSVIAVSVMTGVALVFLPHWSAAFFVLPMITMIFVDILGVMQLAGVHINAVSYITLIISVGLMVDFTLHMIIRYHEEFGNRYQKTMRMMETMGISILVGGLTTFLGTFALAFSKTSSMFTVFVGFFGLVTLGMAHSLILFPVVLSTIGPQDNVVARRRSSVLAPSASTFSRSSALAASTFMDEPEKGSSTVSDEGKKPSVEDDDDDDDDDSHAVV